MHAIRHELARRLPRGVQVRLSRTREIESVEGLEPLRALFESHLRNRIQSLQDEALHRVRSAESWHPLDELVAKLRSADLPVKDGEDVLGLPQLDFSKRSEALRRLYRLSDPSTKTLHWGDRALLITIAHPKGPPPFKVWEVYQEDHATYLFRPKDEQQAALMEWLSEPGPPRSRLLQDAELQARVGFVGRVLHADGKASLEAWWGRITEVLGRSSRPPGGA